MSYTLTLNSSNVVGSGNNTYKFNFAAGGFPAKDCEIAIGSLTIPYSWFNVTTGYGNNTFSLNIPTSTADTSTKNTPSFILANGFYQVSDINNTIQQYLYTNGYYLNNSSGQVVYYINLATNATYYRVDILFSAVPSVLPTGYTLPTTGKGWGLGLPIATKNNHINNSIKWSRGYSWFIAWNLSISDYCNIYATFKCNTYWVNCKRYFMSL